MQILLADPDITLLTLVRRTLEAEGHRVRVASAPQALDVAVADGELDVVLLDVDLAGRATEACERLRASGAYIFVTSASSDGAPSVSKLRSWFGEAGYLRKPFSVLDLPYELQAVARMRGDAGVRSRSAGADLLGRMAARGASGPRRGERPPVQRANRSLMPRVGGPVVFPVAERLAGAWLERFTGQVRVRASQTPVGRPIVLRDGGLVDSRDTSIMDIALRGSQLQFVPDDTLPTGPGDRVTFIQTLWAAVYQPSEVRFAEVRAFEAVELRQSGRIGEIAGLVGPVCLAVLEAADGSRALGEVIVQQGTTPMAMSAELQALHRLGLIHFAPPVAQRVDRRRAPAPATERRTDSAPRRPSADRRSGSRRSSDRRSAARRTSFASRRSSASLITTPGLAAQSSSARRPTSKAERVPPTPEGRRSGRAEVAAHMRRASRSGAIHKRLELEVARLKDAAPAEVLGVPHDSTSKLAQEVGERMRLRYQDIVDDEAYPEETRELAEKLVARIVHSVERWGHSQERAAADPTTAREQVMLEQARVLIDAGDFPRADRVLTKARELAMANPLILASLGWARFHNPDKPVESRREEGRDYLLLAEQFDNAHVRTEWELCQVLRTMGEDAAALRRAERVLSLEPGHPDAKEAVRALTEKLQPAGGSR